jgi:phosphate uptake regulator
MDPRSEVMEIILEMGTFAKKALRLSMRALTQRDIGFFEQVEEAEKRTDELNIKIEEICYQQLRKKELSEEEFRFFSITPQISDRIERFADLATNINNITKRGMPKPITIPLESLGFMSEIFEVLLKKT